MTRYTFLRQRVFHDGTSMIVVKKGAKAAVPYDMLADFIADKSIAAPKEEREPVADGDAPA